MQTKWVNDLSGQPFIEMIKIPAGNFTMGSNESSYNSEKPEREVFLQDYYISKYPITNKQFFHFIQETGYNTKGHNFLQYWVTNPDGSQSPPEELLDHPVVYVNWMDCYAFCKTYGLTLPTEAQWEKAARGTDQRLFPWGDTDPDPIKPQCNFRNIFEGTTPVGTFDGSRESYNGVPIQKGTSPYGVEDMAGNVWEWCLDEWDSKWLQNMGEDPKDPCNYQKRDRKGLNLNQVRSLFIQHQEEDQGPFRDMECCGEVRGATSFPPISVSPIATTSFRRTGAKTSMALESASKEEEIKEQLPFRDTECCGAVRGATTIPPTSAPPFATSIARRSGITTSGCVVASKQKEEAEEEQLPFRDSEDCGVVRGTSSILPTSTLPLATTSNRRTGTITTASESASEQEEEKEQNPFLEIESCGAVLGTTTIPPTSAPPIATTSTRRSGTTATASESAFEQEEEAEEQSPFQGEESYGAVRGTTSIPPTSAPPLATAATRRTMATTSASESASKEEEAEEQSPFQEIEHYEEPHGAITFLSTFVPPIERIMNGHIVDMTITGSEYAFKQQELFCKRGL